MSAFVGIWNLDGRPIEPSLPDRLLAQLTHRGPDGLATWTEGPVAFGTALMRVAPESEAETQPFVHASGVVVAFDGRLDDRPDLLTRIGSSASLPPAAPDVELVAASYEALGESFPEHLNGDFAIAVFDPKRQRLLLVRDAMGMRPCHYFLRAGKLLVFASEVKAILAHPEVTARPQGRAVAQFLLQGVHPETYGSDTFFEDVFSVPAAHVALFGREGARQRKYWDFNGLAQTRHASFEGYAEEFRHHFERAVGRRLRASPQVAVSVSGGLDSSSIFTMGMRLARLSPGVIQPPSAATAAFPPGTEGDEVTFVEEIERACGVSIARVPVVPTGPMEGIAESTRVSEMPMTTMQWFVLDPLYRQLGAGGARRLLTGLMADELLFNFVYLNDLVDRLALWDVVRHLRQIPRWNAEAEPSQFKWVFVRYLAMDHLPGRLRPVVRGVRKRVFGRPPTHPWWTPGFVRMAWEGQERLHPRRRSFSTLHGRDIYVIVRERYTALRLEWESKVAARFGLDLALPFLDRELVSFLMAAPGEELMHGGIPKAVLRKGMQGILPDRIVQRRWKAGFSGPVEAGLLTGWSDIRDLVRGDMAAVEEGYLDGRSLQAAFDRMQPLIEGGDTLAARWVFDVLALESWLASFFP